MAHTPKNSYCSLKVLLLPQHIFWNSLFLAEKKANFVIYSAHTFLYYTVTVKLRNIMVYDMLCHMLCFTFHVHYHHIWWINREWVIIVHILTYCTPCALLIKHIVYMYYRYQEPVSSCYLIFQDYTCTMHHYTFSR